MSERRANLAACGSVTTTAYLREANGMGLPTHASRSVTMNPTTYKDSGWCVREKEYWPERVAQLHEGDVHLVGLEQAHRGPPRQSRDAGAPAGRPHLTARTSG